MELVSEKLINEQYSGNNKLIRPLFDELIRNVKQFGKDIDISPGENEVSLLFNNQFAEIRPTAESKIEILMKMPDVEYTERLIPTSQNDANKYSHMVSISRSEDIDYELYNWLKSAYERMKFPLFSK